MPVPLGCPVSTLTGSVQSTGPPWPTGSDPGVGACLATSADGAGTTSARQNAAARLGRWSETTYRAPFIEFSGAFESYGCAASSGGDRGGRDDRNRARRAHWRTAGVGRGRKRCGTVFAKERGGQASYTRGGEHNGRWPVTIWSPEALRRRSQAAARSGAQRGGR